MMFECLKPLTRNRNRKASLPPRPVVLPDRSEFERLAALLNSEEHRRWVERPYLFIFPVTDVIAAFVAAESIRREFHSTWRF